MKNHVMRAAIAATVLALTPVGLQPAIAQQEWPTYGGDLGNRRYAAMDQINAGNFSELEVAWRLPTVNFGPEAEYKFESTPLVKGGTLFTTAGSRRSVVALDAATGEILWVYRMDEGKRGLASPRRLSGRGLSYWSDGKAERILFVTPGYRLAALDARTGHPDPSFGTEGVVDLKRDFDQEVDPEGGDVGLHATPLVVGDVVVVGAAHGQSNSPTSSSNTKGFVRGFDVRSGRRLWTFHTIPTKSEFGYDSWLNGSADRNGNAGVWTQMAADPELGMVYLPVESATSDWYGGNRPGNGLFAESIVAVDVATGKRRWHYQLVHHGLWDYDIASPPMLVDAMQDGRIVKAIAQPTKQGLLFVLDRHTGKPVWPIPEVPVPGGSVPGEWYSPTQPMPPINYGRKGIGPDDLIDFTPELKAEAMEKIREFRTGPLYTPPAEVGKDGLLGTLYPVGGSNWPGGAFDPETRHLYVTSSPGVGVTGVAPNPDGSGVAYGLQGGNDPKAALAFLGGGRLDVQGLPLLKPPYGLITSIDLNSGRIAWQIPNAETPDAITDNPALAGRTLARTGRPGLVAALVTKSLLIVGEPGFGPTPSGKRGSMLRAYDKISGKEVGAVYLPAPESGSPMTYMVDGRQFLVVAVGGAGVPGELIALTLPH